MIFPVISANIELSFKVQSMFAQLFADVKVLFADVDCSRLEIFAFGLIALALLWRVIKLQ